MKFVILVTLALLAVVFAEDEPIPILRSESNVNPDGSYAYAYETGNGISAEQSGALKDVGTEELALAVQGQYEYTDPSGQVVKLQYVADENGFQPSGDNLPVPPPIPEAIVRALEYIRAHPPPEGSK